MLDGLELPDQVADAFAAIAGDAVEPLLKIRNLIFEEAARLNVGPVTETLKWGQPSYLVKKGTTLRLGVVQDNPAIFVHCQTSIIETARELFGGVAQFSDNRALILGGDTRAATHVICSALAYHQRGARA